MNDLVETIDTGSIDYICNICPDLSAESGIWYDTSGPKCTIKVNDGGKLFALSVDSASPLGKSWSECLSKLEQENNLDNLKLLCHNNISHPSELFKVIRSNDVSGAVKNSENKNSENKNSENMNSENMNSENMNSENMNSENMNSENMNSGKNVSCNDDKKDQDNDDRNKRMYDIVTKMNKIGSKLLGEATPKEEDDDADSLVQSMITNNLDDTNSLVESIIKNNKTSPNSKNNSKKVVKEQDDTDTILDRLMKDSAARGQPIRNLTKEAQPTPLTYPTKAICEGKVKHIPPTVVIPVSLSYMKQLSKELKQIGSGLSKAIDGKTDLNFLLSLPALAKVLSSVGTKVEKCGSNLEDSIKKSLESFRKEQS